MSPYKLAFDTLPWTYTAIGSRFKQYNNGTQQIRLVEFTDEFMDTDWCEKTHTGIVLLGELEVDFQGSLIRYAEGDVILIPSGAVSAHKARSVTPLVRLSLIEQLNDSMQ